MVKGQPKQVPEKIAKGAPAAPKEEVFQPPPNNRDYLRWPPEHAAADGKPTRRKTTNW